MYILGRMDGGEREREVCILGWMERDREVCILGRMDGERERGVYIR